MTPEDGFVYLEESATPVPAGATKPESHQAESAQNLSSSEGAVAPPLHTDESAHPVETWARVESATLAKPIDEDQASRQRIAIAEGTNVAPQPVD